MKLSDFGFTEGINEVIGITFFADGRLNTAPLGVIVEDADSVYAKVRLYPSHTRQNLAVNPVLWVNVTTNPIVFAISAFDDLGDDYFESLNPPITKGSLAWCKFRAELKGDFAYLELLEGKVLRKSLRTVNRGFNALIEALVHATRYVKSGSEELLKKIEYYCEIVDKCGSKDEKLALEIMKTYIFNRSNSRL